MSSFERVGQVSRFCSLSLFTPPPSIRLGFRFGSRSFVRFFRAYYACQSGRVSKREKQRVLFPCNTNGGLPSMQLHVFASARPTRYALSSQRHRVKSRLPNLLTPRHPQTPTPEAQANRPTHCTCGTNLGDAVLILSCQKGFCS